MKVLLSIIAFILISISGFAQNQNISGGSVFDGEPYLAVDPNNSQQMVVAWMGYVFLNKIAIKVKSSSDGGQTWSTTNAIPHIKPSYGSADPSLGFDKNGNLFLSYIDFDESIDSGAVYVAKSIDGGLTWLAPKEVINIHSDGNQKPLDRPWIAVDATTGANAGNVYVTTISPDRPGLIPAPYHPYFIHSTNNGNSFNSWRHLDTVNWLSGNAIPQPMASPVVSSNGTFHALYPSYVSSQNLYAQYILASSTDGGSSLSYKSAFNVYNTNINEPLAKKGVLLRANPADANHLAFLHLDEEHGDLDVFLKESIDNGNSWSLSKRVNDDPIGNNRMQDLVWASFDNDGDLFVSWRDRRNGTDSTYSTSSEIWGAIKWKDSVSFSPNFKVSDALIAHDTVLNSSGNDFMSVVMRNDTLNAVWGDVRNGKLNIWFQRMDAHGIPLSVKQLSQENIPSVNLYPNPVTTYVTLTGRGLLEATVLNINGEVILKSKNNQSLDVWNVKLGSLESGVYFIQVTTEFGTITKKVLKK